MVARGYEITNIFEATRAGVEAGDFANEAWSRARAAHIARYWSGEDAPEGRRAEARALWDDVGLTLRFDCRQTEPLVASEKPRLDQKSIGLWERDVCEMFITPEAKEIRRYFEFEVAPTGEWLDLSIKWTRRGTEKDWHFNSGMTVASRVSEGALTLAMRVPWKQLGSVPRAGERWRCNLFRCVGAGETRGYITWQPTHTPEPQFHIPDKFGWLKFS